MSTCYICQQEGAKIRPCVNELCQGRTHAECLKKQVESNNLKCGICRSDIMTNDDIDKDKLLNIVYWIFYSLITTIIDITFIVFFSFKELVIIIPASVILIIAFISKNANIYYYIINYNTYLNKHLSLIICSIVSVAIIILCRSVGSLFVNKVNDGFNIGCFLVGGLIVSLSCIGFALIAFAIKNIHILITTKQCGLEI